MATKTKKITKKEKTNPVVAKSKDGTIQITLKIPFKDVRGVREIAAKEIGKDIEISGFRKGKAPLNKLLASIPENTLIEKTLRGILPELVTKIIKEHKLKIAIFPRFELISAKENEDWQVRAVTCELPEINVDNYKKIVKESAKSGAQTKDKSKKEITKEEKEQRVITTLIENIKIDIPKPLIENEVERRLSELLERIEKLGLTLETYLSSIGKKPEDLRTDYEKQATETIKLDLILSKIAEKENVKVSKKEVDKTLEAYSTSGEPPNVLEERRAVIKSILKKRAALDALVSLL